MPRIARSGVAIHERVAELPARGEIVVGPAEDPDVGDRGRAAAGERNDVIDCAKTLVVRRQVRRETLFDDSLARPPA
jgi:hypothetical protein